MPGILALDPATVIGWAHSEPGATPTWGSLRLGQDGDDEGKVGVALSLFLEARIEVLRPQFVVKEAPYVPRPSAARVKTPRFTSRRTAAGMWYGGLTTLPLEPSDPDDQAGPKPINPQTLRRLLGISFLIATICAQHRIPCREVSSLAVTKFFVDTAKFPGKTVAQKTAAKKRAMVARCHMLGWKVTDNNQADALGLLCYAEAKLLPEMRLSMRRPAGPLFVKG